MYTCIRVYVCEYGEGEAERKRTRGRSLCPRKEIGFGERIHLVVSEREAVGVWQIRRGHKRPQIRVVCTPVVDS